MIVLLLIDRRQASKSSMGTGGIVFSGIISTVSDIAGSDEGGEDEVVVQPTQTYQQWGDSLDWPYHMNGGGVCVKGN